MKNYYRNIIFSKTPLTTKLYFEGQFQIFPCMFENAPTSKILDIFPIVLEYWIDDSEIVEVPEEFKSVSKFISKIDRRSFEVEKIVRLLSAITNHKFFSHSGKGIAWGFPIPDEVTDENRDEIDNQSSQIFLNAYSYPSLFNDLYITSFTEQNFANPLLVDHRIYYLYDPIDNKDKKITFPHTIFRILKNTTHLILNQETSLIQLLTLSIMALNCSIK